MAVPNVQRDSIESVVQFLDRISLNGSARMVERESGMFFNMAYFEDCFVRGAFEIAEDYLTSFTRVHDNNFTINVVFELRWHKFLAALYENRHDEAKLIIREKLQPLAVYNSDLLGFANSLVNLPNFRMHEAFMFFGEPKYHRRERIEILRANLNSNPLLVGKLRYSVHGVYATLVMPPPIPTALAIPASSLVPVVPAPSIPVAEVLVGPTLVPMSPGQPVVGPVPVGVPRPPFVPPRRPEDHNRMFPKLRRRRNTC